MEIQQLVYEAANRLAEGMVVTDANLEEPGPTILFANRAMEKLTGYTQHELLGKNPRVLQGDSTDKEQRKWMKMELAAGRAVNVTIENYRKDKSTYWVELSIECVKDETGQITHYVAIQRDVSREKELERLLLEQADKLTVLRKKMEAVLG